MCQFVQTFISYVSAKYSLNYFTVKKVIAKIRKGNLLLRHSVVHEGFYSVTGIGRELETIIMSSHYAVVAILP